MTMCRDHIQEYFANGFQLVPLKREVLADGTDDIKPNSYGKPVTIRDEKGTSTGLNPDVALSNYDNFVEYIIKHPYITMMGLYPKYNGYLVLDLDNHAGKDNGIRNFLELCKGANLSTSMAAMLADFPHKFPCWVETPHQGIHLYFKARWVPSNWDKVSNQNGIDIKFNTQVTAAGSIRGDATKTDVNYIMHGFLEDAPQITLDLLDVFTKPKPAPAMVWHRPAGKPFAAGQGTQQKAKWNTTTDGIIDMARMKAGSCNAHDFVCKCGTYFKKARMEDGVEISFDEALAAVEATPEHQNRKDKHDTKTCLMSYFR